MRGNWRGVAGAIALAILLGPAAPRPARAGMTVSYNTSGAFHFGQQNGSTITLSSGNTNMTSVQLSFVGVNESNHSAPDLSALFGTFTAKTIASGNANLGTSGSFDLQLTQTDPTI